MVLSWTIFIAYEYKLNSLLHHHSTGNGDIKQYVSSGGMTTSMTPAILPMSRNSSSQVVHVKTRFQSTQDLSPPTNNSKLNNTIVNIKNMKNSLNGAVHPDRKWVKKNERRRRKVKQVRRNNVYLHMLN